MKSKKKFIAALESGKYEKHLGSFVPTKLDEQGNHVLVKKNCACALGVFLIEIAKIPAEELAHAHHKPLSAKHYKILDRMLGFDVVRGIYRINDERMCWWSSTTQTVEYGEARDKTFGTVIEYLKGL